MRKLLSLFLSCLSWLCPHKNAYTCPVLMQLTAWLYAVRYTVFWSDGLAFRQCSNADGETWGVELQCVFPKWMRKCEWKLSGRVIYSLFLSCLFVLLCGCETPVESVELGLNPLGGVNVAIHLKGGQVLRFDNVPMGDALAMQKKYRVPSSRVRWVSNTRAVDSCGCVDQTRAIASASQPMTITDTKGRVLWDATENRDLTRRDMGSIVVKPSLAKRVQNVVMLRNPHHIGDSSPGHDTPVSRSLRNCAILDEPFTESESAALPPTTGVGTGGGGTPPPTGAPPSGEMRSLSLESRVQKLEQRMDGVSSQVDGLRGDLQSMKNEILQAMKLK